MYIMDIKLLGFTFRLEVVLICVLLSWILGLHLLCSCMKITPYDGFQIVRNNVETFVDKAANLDYKMSAGIELKKNPDKEVVGFMEDFKKEHETVAVTSCSA